MSREILFRGQMRKKGEKVNLADEPLEGIWVYGGIFPQNEGGDFSIIYTYEPIDKRVVYADTVGQYTGLHDNTHWDDLSEEEKEDWLKHHTKDGTAERFLREILLEFTWKTQHLSRHYL